MTTAITTFPLSEVQQLRKQATKARKITATLPDGWSKSTLNPMAVVAVFNRLRVKQGYVLHAYQFCEAGDGRGVVWAMPLDTSLPDPEECPRLENVLAGPPKPIQAMDDFMEAVEGDGSPWSYLHASILSRELHEVGAVWHGCQWTPHRIIDKPPWNEEGTVGLGAIDASPGIPEEWACRKIETTDWRPHASEEGDVVTVVFFSFNGYGQEIVYRHTDSYRKGKYSFTTRSEVIAVGPNGVVS